MQLSNPPPKPKQLTEKDVSQFIEQGYLVVRQAFSRELAERILPMVWAELNIDPDDQSTWSSPKILLRKVLETQPAPQIHTERYLGAVDDLCGQGRWHSTSGVGHWPILFPGFASPPWRPPEGGWHVDISLDHHCINSPELGLLCLELFTDIEPGGGGTAVRLGTHRYIARILAGSKPHGLSGRELVLHARAATEHLPVVEINGNAGDILLLHPFTLHAASSNTSDRVRIAAIKLIRLYEPMNLERPDCADYSPLEFAIVEALREKANHIRK